MARRLRPPSEPSRPTNGYSPHSNGQLPQAGEDAPWAADLDLRSDIPWDRPAAEAWPPADEPAEHQVDEPMTEQAAWPPAPVYAAQPAAPAQPQAASAPSTWDDLPTTWDKPAAWDGPGAEWAAPEVEPEPALVADEPEPVVPPVDQALEQPVDTPVAQPVESVAEPVSDETEDVSGPAMDATVPGRAPWDRPADYSWDDLPFFDDRPAEMLADYEQEPAPAPAAVAAVPEAVAPAAAPEPAPDPYDADAPILQDVERPAAAVAWPAWPETIQPIAPAPVAGRAIAPTPPEDLFAAQTVAQEPAPEPEPELELEVEPEPEAEQYVETPAATSTVLTTQAPGQPLVLRIELAIVDPSARVHPAEIARQVGPVVERELQRQVEAQSLVFGAPVADESPAEESVTPRHPEFEPRNHLIAPPQEVAPWDEPAEPSEPQSLPWGLPSLDEPASAAEAVEAAEAVVVAEPEPEPVEQPAPAPAEVDLWAAPDPTADWHIEPARLTAPAFEPLAEVPATAFVAVPPPAAPMTQAVAQAAATPLAKPATEQADLWFLAAEPQSAESDQPQAVAPAAQPSSMITVGLTVLMAVVVIGLVIAFLWLMTSLPILR